MQLIPFGMSSKELEPSEAEAAYQAVIDAERAFVEAMDSAADRGERASKTLSDARREAELNPVDWVEGELHPRTERACFYRVSKQAAVIDGRLMHLWAEFESAIGQGEFKLPTWFARVELRENGVPRIANIGFESDDGQREPSGSDFDRLRSAVMLYYSAFCAEIGPDGEPRFRIDVDSDKRIHEFIEQRRTGRRRLKTDDYQRAAQVYRDNIDDTPTKAVAEAFGVGIRRAGDIVAECRRRKFLGPTKQGRKSL